MNKPVTQPAPVSAEEGSAISSSPTRIAVEANGRREAVRRRDIAALLGGALGVLALSKCGGEPQNGASSQRSEQVGRLAQGLSGSDIKWVNTTLGAPLNAPWTGDLATRYGPADGGQFSLGANVVIAEGCIKSNDGGGGIFYWVTGAPPPVNGASSGDGGTTIVPTNQPSPPTPQGYWQRIVSEPVSVRWFGAAGDGVTDDTLAIQRSIDFIAYNFLNANSPYQWNACTGDGGTAQFPYQTDNDVIIPPGTYLVTAPTGGAALWLAANGANLIGMGAAGQGAELIVTGGGSGVVIEASAAPDSCSNVPAYYPTSGPRAAFTQLRNIFLHGSMLDGIVVHTPVAFYDCSVAGASRHGVLIESGTAGADLIGVTRAPTGEGVLVDHSRLTNIRVFSCGDQSSNGDESKGAGIYLRGHDANGITLVTMYAASCNVGFYDASLAGATWIGCYSEGGKLGYKNAATSTSVYINCYSEDITQGAFVGASALTIGGTLTQIGPQGADLRIGGASSQLTFGTIGIDGATYGARIPGGSNSGIDIYRTGPAPSDGGAPPPLSRWAFAYQPYPAPAYALPYQQQSWRWAHFTGGANTPDAAAPGLDPNDGPFGWTDAGHPRGSGLGLIASPLMNTRRRWSWKQFTDQSSTTKGGVPIKLRQGSNIIFLNGTSSDGVHGADVDNGGGGVLFTNAGTDFWPAAKIRVSVDIEFASMTDLSNGDLRVVGYLMVPKPSTANSNVAVKIVNAGASEITVTLVWHFEMFVTNNDALDANGNQTGYFA